MRLFKSIGRVFEKAVHHARHIVTQPFTRSVRHQIEDQYHRAMSECARSEQETRNKLQAQHDKELKEIYDQREKLEETRRDNKERFEAEQTKLTQYLQEKEQAIKKALEELDANFTLLRAALHACKTGKEEEQEFIKLVLQRDPNLRAKFLTLNPLHIVADNNHAGLVPLLCRYGIDIQAKNEAGDTPLDITEERGHVETAEAIRAALKETVIFWQAVDKEDMAAMKASLESGAAINASFFQGINILQFAIIRRKPYELIHWLVEEGADCRYLAPDTVLTLSETEQEVERLHR